MQPWPLRMQEELRDARERRKKTGHITLWTDGSRRKGHAAYAVVRADTEELLVVETIVGRDLCKVIEADALHCAIKWARYLRNQHEVPVLVRFDAKGIDRYLKRINPDLRLDGIVLEHRSRRYNVAHIAASGASKASFQRARRGSAGNLRLR